jgi:hypothetical protein
MVDLGLIFDLLEGFVLLKIAFLILNALYVAFLLVIYKQTHAMNRVVTDSGASTLVNTVALINILLGISLFVAALVIL